MAATSARVHQSPGFGSGSDVCVAFMVDTLTQLQRGVKSEGMTDATTTPDALCEHGEPARYCRKFHDDAPERRLCAHADQNGEGAHWLEPGERCPLGTSSSPDSRAIASDTPEPAADGACTCWATSPNGCPQHYERDNTPTCLGRDMDCGRPLPCPNHPAVPTPAELLAERFGLEERPNTARAHAIAAIHALADFYTAHPEIPAPWSVRANSSAADMDELRSLAETHGAKVYGSNPLAQQFDITVRRRERGSDVPDMGIIVSVRPPERPL